MTAQKQSNRFVNLIGIIMIALAISLTVVSRAIDVDTITAPFESMMEETVGGTYIGDKVIDRVHEYEAERSAKKEDPNAAGKIATKITGNPTISKAQAYYIKFQAFVEKMENLIAQLDNKFIIVISLLLLFSIKSIIALIPVSATCLISAIIFPFPVALIINLAGYSLIFTVKYFWGKHIGEGNVSKLMKHSEFLWKFIQDEENGYATGNPTLLFILRLVPTVPINPISQMYGKMGYSFPKYLILSVLGAAIKIISFTAIGSNVGDPFSKQFVIPLITILFISGFSTLAFSFILKYRNSPDRKKMMV